MPSARRPTFDDIADEWRGLIELVRREAPQAVETTMQRMMTLSTYAAIDQATLRATVENRFAMVIDGLAEHRPPGLASDDMDSDAYGELRARQGVTFSELLTGWRFGGDALYRLARELAPDTPTRDTILLEFIELTMRWVDFASLAMAGGHRRGEMSRARELQHVQTNLVRRVIVGTVTPMEIRASLEPLGLDPQGQYLAVCARPGPAADIHTIEQYLGVDGMRGRRQGLTALVDGTLCGFVLPALPRQPAPTAIGVSEPATLTTFEAPFRRANRALATATAFGTNGVFAFSSLALQASIVGDPDVGDVLRIRYIDPLQAVAGGPAILSTVQHYLANDGRVDGTADALGIHVNTVRHRLKRFEELTGRSLTNSEVAVELWLALEAHRLLNDTTRA